jgi:membrane protein YqaA with SNARE-associated domain
MSNDSRPAIDPPSTAPASVRTDKRPHLLRRLYDWTLHWAHTPYAMAALILVAFAESSFFLVPPDVLLIAMVLGHRQKAFRYATVCTVASVLGALAGLAIGYYLIEPLGRPIIDFYHLDEEFHWVTQTLGANMNLYIFIAAFTPIPYKVFTIAAGVVAADQQVDLVPFIASFTITSAIGRGARFFLVTALLYFFGERIRRFIDRYFEWCALALGVLVILFFVLLKYLF